MRSKRWLTVLLFCVTTGYGLTRVFHVDPVKASWSGWTAQDLYVSEVVTLNVDSLGPPAYAQLFVGLQQGSGNYEAHVRSYPGGATDLAHVSVSPPASDHQWLKFNLIVDYPDSFVKGRRYEFRFRRVGSRLHFYYDYCATKWDSMIVPGQDQPAPQPVRPALAMRTVSAA